MSQQDQSQALAAIQTETLELLVSINALVAYHQNRRKKKPNPISLKRLQELVELLQT